MLILKKGAIFSVVDTGGKFTADVNDAKGIARGPEKLIHEQLWRHFPF
jgi:hypothetical protein